MSPERENNPQAERLLQERDTEGSFGTGSLSGMDMPGRASRFVPVTGQMFVQNIERYEGFHIKKVVPR